MKLKTKTGNAKLDLNRNCLLTTQVDGNKLRVLGPDLIRVARQGRAISQNVT